MDNGLFGVQGLLIVLLGVFIGIIRGYIKSQNDNINSIQKNIDLLNKVKNNISYKKCESCGGSDYDIYNNSYKCKNCGRVVLY